MEKLEQILYKPSQVSETKQVRKIYRIGDLEKLSVLALYTGPVGGCSGFSAGGHGNLFQDYDLGDLTKDKSLNGWKLQERFDFSGHGGSGPHINYGLSGPNGGYHGNILGDAHKIDLD